MIVIDGHRLSLLDGEVLLGGAHHGEPRREFQDSCGCLSDAVMSEEKAVDWICLPLFRSLWNPGPEA